MQERSSDDRDNDPTDELPVLLETEGLDDDLEPLAASPRAEDTAEHTALFAVAADAALPDERLAELTERAAQVPALEAQIRTLADNARNLEQRLAAKDEQLQQVRGALTAIERAKDDSVAAGERLSTQLTLSDTRIAELSATVERLERDAAAKAAQMRQLRETAEAAQRETAALRDELATRPPPDLAPPDADALREDHAALTAYIAGRRAWWEDMQATNTQLGARVAALEHELAANAKRLAAAEAFAEQESSRAVALREELVEYARRADALERELRLVESPAAALANAEVGPQPAPVESAPAVDAAPSIVPAAAAPQTPPVLTDAVETPAAGVEALAQLEAEVEYKRQQVAAQLVELRDREQRLRAVTGDLDRAHRDLGAAQTELDDSRANAARLERAVIDKDRALEARDARIATLHEELKHRLAPAEKREPGGFAPATEAPAPARAAVRETEGMASPALICLTGDAPKRFPLTRRTITIGRGPHCDLQVVTHFVSREHARLTLNGSSAFIEDLGSRNGVFVNSVRVDRQQLQQGDLLTIGETQFRFVESMAH